VHLSRIARSIVRLAWPVLVAQLAVIASGVLDTMMAGRYSAVDLAAVGIGASVYFSVFIGLLGVVQALSPIAGQLYGGKQFDRIGEETRQTAWIAAGLAVLGVLLLAFPEPFLRLSSAPPEVEAKTRDYLHGVAWEWVEDVGGMFVSEDSRGQQDVSLQKFCGPGALNLEQKENYEMLMRVAMLSSMKPAYTSGSMGFRCAADAGAAP